MNGSLCRLVLLVLLFCSFSPRAGALTIASDAPGNVIVVGKTIAFAIKDVSGDGAYEVVDYFGQKVLAGKVAPVVQIAPAKPGWYELTCRDGAGVVTTTFCALMDRGDAPLPEDGRICSDTGAAWLVRGEKFPKFARMVRLAGIPWVRERLSWGGTEKVRGTFDWGQYQTVADVFAAEGVHVYQMWSDSPAWSRPGEKGVLCPDDLRDVYRFSRTAASHFAPQIGAWEVWNEPDGNFWIELADRFASFQKAAYWGLKDGNPHAMVLQGSFCQGVTAFARSSFESGLTDYFDIFNWHDYTLPSSYPATLKNHLDLLADYHTSDRPVWMTEQGIRPRARASAFSMPIVSTCSAGSWRTRQ